MNECPNCGRCCGYDEDGRLVCVCGYHEEAQCRDVLAPPASTPTPGAGR